MDSISHTTRHSSGIFIHIDIFIFICENANLKIFAKFTWKYLWWSLFFNEVVDFGCSFIELGTLVNTFSNELHKIFQNDYLFLFCRTPVSGFLCILKALNIFNSLLTNFKYVRHVIRYREMFHLFVVIMRKELFTIFNRKIPRGGLDFEFLTSFS